jgi:hypothetical protein
MKGAIDRMIVPFIFISLFIGNLAAGEEFCLYLRNHLKDSRDGKTVPVATRRDSVPLYTGQIASVGGASRLEFFGPAGELLRVGHNSEFSPIEQNRLEFSQGSFLFYVQKEGPRYSFVTKGVEILIAGHGTFLGEIMPLGGLKLIPLSGQGQIISQSQSSVEKFYPGQIHFYLPSGERPPNVEIDITLLVNSCPLITAFEDTLPSFREITSRAHLQARTIKLRSNSFVYDAVGKDRIRFLVPQPTEKEGKPATRTKLGQWLKSKLPF